MPLSGLLSASLAFPDRKHHMKRKKRERRREGERGYDDHTDSPSLTTSPIEYSSSPSLPAGLTNSHDILTEAPVGGDMPIVDRAREVTVSVNLYQRDQYTRYILKVVHRHAQSIVSH